MIIVTGLPRAGTQWAAWVLEQLGVEAQHEGVTWNDDYTPVIPDVAAVSSWALAVADLPADAVAFSMRRTKGKWLQSMLESHVAEAWASEAPWVHFARHNLKVSEKKWTALSAEDRALLLFEKWPAPGETLQPGTKKAVFALAEAAGVAHADVDIDRLVETVIDPTVK